jgi:hypothetical protein
VQGEKRNHQKEDDEGTPPEKIGSFSHHVPPSEEPERALKQNDLSHFVI